MFQKPSYEADHAIPTTTGPHQIQATIHRLLVYPVLQQLAGLYLALRDAGTDELRLRVGFNRTSSHQGSTA
eukprot:scaffold784_cov399-Prasinococcus_capsulatus_cf.AAC.6